MASKSTSGKFYEPENRPHLGDHRGPDCHHHPWARNMGENVTKLCGLFEFIIAGAFAGMYANSMQIFIAVTAFGAGIMLCSLESRK